MGQSCLWTEVFWLVKSEHHQRWYGFRASAVIYPFLSFHCMEKSSMNILLNISFCVLRNKKNHTGYDMRVNK